MWTIFRRSGSFIEAATGYLMQGVEAYNFSLYPDAKGIHKTDALFLSGKCKAKNL
jgi:hypothetical protein